MMFLGKLSDSWMFSAIGWSLLHFVWQGVVVAFLLWCALRVLATSSAQTRYLTACTALAITMLLPVATFVHLVSEHKTDSEHRRITVAVGAAANEKAASVDTSAWLVQMGERLDGITPWIVLVWFTGAILFLGRLQVGILIVRRTKVSKTWPVEAELTRIFEMAKKRLAVARPVQLLHSAFVQVPAVAGWLRPVVLIPAGSLSGLSPEQIEAILCHELAHIVRHDCLVSVVQSVVEGLLFYHPAVWWISNQVRFERECCCDEFVVSSGADVLVYARALFSLATKQASYPELALAANGGVLTMRIKRLTGYKTNETGARAGALVMLVMITFAASVVGQFARAESHDSKKMALVSSGHVQSATLRQPEPSALPHSIRESINTTGVDIPVETKTLKLAWSLIRETSPTYESASRTIAPVPVNVQSTEVPLDAETALAPDPVQVPAKTMASNKIGGVTPRYPADAKAKHISGAVVMDALISEEGNVDRLTVTSGPDELRDSALTAVRQWKYKPYLLDGVPTAVKTTITVNYSFGD